MRRYPQPPMNQGRPPFGQQMMPQQPPFMQQMPQQPGMMMSQQPFMQQPGMQQPGMMPEVEYGYPQQPGMGYPQPQFGPDQSVDYEQMPGYTPGYDIQQPQSEFDGNLGLGPQQSGEYGMDSKMGRIEREIVELNRRMNRISRRVRTIEDFLNIRDE
jgi:hypothetical protein